MTAARRPAIRSRETSFVAPVKLARTGFMSGRPFAPTMPRESPTPQTRHMLPVYYFPVPYGLRCVRAHLSLQ